MATTETAWTDDLDGACSDGLTWARTQPDLQTAWRTCERGDWMLWYVQRQVGIGRDTDGQRALWRARADCAALALPIYEKRYPNDRRVRDCIQAVRDYADGKINDDGLRSASASAASAYVVSASYASYTASDAASAAAAYAAANAYAEAADAAYAADAAAARGKTLKACADIVRRHFPSAPSKGGA